MAVGATLPRRRLQDRKRPQRSRPLVQPVPERELRRSGSQRYGRSDPQSRALVRQSGLRDREPLGAIADRQAARFHKLWECGFADLIRADFYSVLALPDEASGNLLDAGCGTGIEA